MKIERILRATIVFCIIISFLSTSICFAQKEMVIIAVRVKGNKAISEATILSKIKSKAGQKFNQDILNDDLKRLYALGYFTDVSMDVEDYKEGVMITVIVEEKPIVEDVVFEGNKKVGSKTLKNKMQIKAGEMLNYSKLSQDINELKDLYRKKGFQNIAIDYRIKTNKEENTATIKVLINERLRMRIKKVTVGGNVAVKTGVILDMMQTRPAWLLRRGYFDEEIFNADLEKITRHYQNLGYLDAKVTPSFDFDKTNKLIYVNLHVEEGTLYKTGNVTMSGKTVFPLEEVEKLIYMKKGDPFSYSVLSKDMNDIRQFYFLKGYMNVDIKADRKIDPSTNTIDLHYRINAGDVVYVGMIDIKGNTKTKDVVIRRELRIYPGERFDGDKIKRSKERLYNLGFFEDVYFDTQGTSDEDVRNLTISVKETKTGEFAFGGGYSSVDEFLGFVQITQKNFDLLNFPYFTGDGQFLSVRANLGTIRMDFDLSWTEPWIFDYPLSFGFDAYHRTHARQSQVGYGYQETRTGGDLRLGKEFGEYLASDIMYKLENVNITDLPDDATQDLVEERGDNWISIATLGIKYDTRDNIFSPRKGFLTQLVLENAGGPVGFDKDFWKAFFLVSYYYTFFDKFVLELKGRTGVADAYWNTDNVPIYERFYAGGAYTIRGYRERRVGPRDPGSNAPIGGESMGVGNAEVTFPIYEKIIKGAVFYDIGSVWRRWEDYFTGDFKSGVGAGVRVKTPIGPLKLDCGYPLNDNHNDEKKLEWYFSVSHGF
ncbi:MAG: outer membrane protein assembly factor BamA [Candidatus Omnitrophica bacterium]|nr:outer membrane protein assembly factor BamA [Candidatus Omnitrophota bacterium]